MAQPQNQSQSKELDAAFLPAQLQEALRRYVWIEPEQTSRLEKALRYVQAGRVHRCEMGSHDLFVESESQRDEATGDFLVYRVGDSRCECADFEYHKAVCAHRLARRIYWRREELRSSEANAACGVVTTSEQYVNSGAQLAGVEAHYAKNVQHREVVVELTDEELEARWVAWCKEIEAL